MNENIFLKNYLSILENENKIYIGIYIFLCFPVGKQKGKKKCVQTDLGYCPDCIVREGFVL